MSQVCSRQSILYTRTVICKRRLKVLCLLSVCFHGFVLLRLCFTSFRLNGDRSIHLVQYILCSVSCYFVSLGVLSWVFFFAYRFDSSPLAEFWDRWIARVCFCDAFSSLSALFSDALSHFRVIRMRSPFFTALTSTPSRHPVHSMSLMMPLLNCWRAIYCRLSLSQSANRVM